MKSTKRFSFLLICILFSTTTIAQRTISIDTTITSNTEIYLFSQNDTVYGLKFTGDIVLNSDNSLVRVIFTDANNEIYNNQFHNNYYATIIEGTNRGDSTGLCIKCNDYYQNKNDIFVVTDTSLREVQVEQGIAEYQGSVTDTTTTGPAGNTDILKN